MDDYPRSPLPWKEERFRLFRLSPSALARPRLSAAWLVLFALAPFALSGCETIPVPPAGPQAAAPANPAAPPPGENPAATPGQPQAAANQIRVALLLPLSGQNAALGGALLDAAQMALYDVADERLQLLPRDTHGTPQGAADAARAVLGQGATLIIGPLLASEVEAVKPLAHAANVPMLAFSTATQLAGDGTYLMGFLPRQEIERVVNYAHGKGVNRFAALAPKTPYGEIAVEALRDTVQADGATIERIDYYDPSVQDVSPVVQRFAGAPDAVPAKPSKNAANAPPVPEVVIPFDAVLLPEGGQRLRAVAPILPYYDVDPEKVHFLGTGLWDEPGLGTEPALIGGWYAAPPPAARADFERRFQELYHHAPPRLATLGYDATALAAVLARSPSTGGFSPTGLTNPSGFAGLDGIFRFRSDGLIQRGLAVLEVRRNGNAVIDPAPTTFQSVSY